MHPTASLYSVIADMGDNGHLAPQLVRYNEGLKYLHTRARAEGGRNTCTISILLEILEYSKPQDEMGDECTA
jgi:hypothetical protein